MTIRELIFALAPFQGGFDDTPIIIRDKNGVMITPDRVMFSAQGFELRLSGTTFATDFSAGFDIGELGDA